MLPRLKFSVGISAILSRIPVLMRWSGYALTTPLLLVVGWFVVTLAIRISNSLIDRAIYTWKVHPFLDPTTK
jgi:small conductance mechanosensitive channel